MVRKMGLFFALVFLCGAFSFPVYAREMGSITVSGEGSVSIEPDVAHVFLGVETQNANALEAQTLNSRTMTAVLAAIKALGIDEGDIQTARFSMHPMQDWREGTGVVVGYQVSNSVQITVRDISQVGAVLGAATEAGANMHSHITFGLLDDTAAYNEALASAVANAQEKARVIAEAMGVRLGTAIHVSETSNINFIPQGRIMAEFAAAPMAMADGGGVPVQGGELTISAHVSVSFNIQP